MFLIISLKTVFENLNLVKGYDKANPNSFVFSLQDNYRWGLTSFGQYIKEMHVFCLCPDMISLSSN